MSPNRSWSPPATLTPGLYYATCNITLVGANRTITATFVTEGNFAVPGARTELRGAVEGLAAISVGDLSISGAGTKVLGLLHTEAELRLSGAQISTVGGLSGRSVTVSGAQSTLSPKLT
jgi:cytoskeletal protein CcmA (bactofilin family)